MYIYRGSMIWKDYVTDGGLTVVVPANVEVDQPVFAYWQWTKTINGEENVNVEMAAVIISVSIDDQNFVSVRLSHDQHKYFDTFDAVFAPDTTDLQVKFRDIYAYACVLSLSLRYPDGPESPFPYKGGRRSIQAPEYVAYTGKLNFSNDEFKAVNELITVVVLQPRRPIEKGAPIYADWQWVSVKYNARLRAGYTSMICEANWCADSVSEELQISFGVDQDYWFVGKFSKTGETLTLSMKPPAKGASSDPFELKLSHLNLQLPPENSDKSVLQTTASSFDIDISQIRPFCTQTSTIENDTDEATWCKLQESATASDRNNTALAIIGEGLAFAGLFLTFIKTPTKKAVTFSFIGLGFATLAMVDCFLLGAEDPSEGLLFPDDNMKRTSQPFKVLGSDNDLVITRVRVREGAIVVQCGQLTELGTNTWKVSQLVGDSSHIKFEDILTFFLPKDKGDGNKTYRMETCTLIATLGGFRPNVQGQLVEDLINPNIAHCDSGTMFTTNTDKTVPRQHNVWEDNSTRLIADINKTFWFFEATFEGFNDRKVVHLPDSKKVLFMLQGYKIDDDQLEGTSVGGGCSDKSDALTNIQKDLDSKEESQEYYLYTWHSRDNKTVYGYLGLPQGTEIIPSGSNRDYIWLVVKEYQHLQRIGEKK